MLPANVMELLVFARNYRPVGAPDDAPSRGDAGAMVGQGRIAPRLPGRLCSFVEVRLPADVIDPGTMIELLLAKALASWGHPGGGRVLRHITARGRVSLMLEPGFQRARDLFRALLPVLPQARALLDRAQPRPSQTRPAQPEPARQHPQQDVHPALPMLRPPRSVAPIPRFVPPPLPSTVESLSPDSESPRVGGTTRTSRRLPQHWR